MRLQTLGVTEHSFDLDIGGVRFNWLLYDVGGAVGPTRFVVYAPANFYVLFDSAARQVLTPLTRDRTLFMQTLSPPFPTATRVGALLRGR